jgi:hypothetical protein
MVSVALSGPSEKALLVVHHEPRRLNIEEGPIAAGAPDPPTATTTEAFPVKAPGPSAGRGPQAFTVSSRLACQVLGLDASPSVKVWMDRS